jgi:hypothetical protein
MFILTIASNDQEVVKKCLLELSQERNLSERGEIGSLTTADENNLGTRYELDFLKEEDFVAMCDFLHFDESGNKLIPQER